MSANLTSSSRPKVNSSQNDATSVPKVTIGMPVYNGEHEISDTLDSLLAQTFTDFELIISDNASTDGTECICQRYAAKDDRIRYVRQTQNLGPNANFMYVLQHGVGEFFMWAAADDWRSPDFLETNVYCLDNNPQFSASTSPNCYLGQQNDPSRYIDFGLLGTRSSRYLVFLKNAWISHGIFYSLMRRRIIACYNFPIYTNIAQDWSINIFLLTYGEIYRVDKGLLVLGKSGMSNRGNPWKTFRRRQVEILFPLYNFTSNVLKLMKGMKISEILPILVELARLNIKASKSNCRLTISNFFK